MTITREQVADLQPGDVVELDCPDQQVFLRGPVTCSGPGNGWHLAGWTVSHGNGEPFMGGIRTLTVVSRAPRPLYVNHPRTEPVPGDVVRDADSDNRSRVWVWASPRWAWLDYPGEIAGDLANVRLRLLVDGETGLPVVPNLAEAWGEGFEAAAEWLRANPGPTGIPHDPPANPYETGQVVPS